MQNLKTKIKNTVLCTAVAGLLFTTSCQTYHRDSRFLKDDFSQKTSYTSNPLESLVTILFAGIGAKPPESPTNFDWMTYQKNFNTFSINKDHNPTFYCFGGWDSHGFSQIFRMTDQIAINKTYSDYKIFEFNDWRDSLKKIQEQYAKESPIILIGHSGGGSNAIKVSKVLEKVNVPVGLLLVDSTHLKSKGYFPPKVDGIPDTFTIPYNVFHVENYTTKGPFEGRKLTKKDFANPRTTFRNNYIKTNHLDCLKTKYISLYLDSINEILNSRQNQNF